MTARRSTLVVLILLAPAARAEPPRQVGPPAVTDLVRDLASPQFAVRERASRELWALGPAAVAAVRAAAAGTDPEATRRAKDLLDKFDAGIFPDTPAAVLARIAEFRAGQQTAAVTGLVKLGDKGYPALRGLLTRDLPPGTAGPVFDHICWVLRGEVPKLLVAGRADLAEDLLSLNALGPSDPGLADYATLLALRGRASAVVTELEGVRKAGGAAGAAATRTLVFVHRAAGDVPRAAALAGEIAGTGPAAQAMYDALLEDAGRWAELADRSARGVGSANSRDGLTLFRLRLAGRHREAEELADRQKGGEVGRAGSDLFGSMDEPTLALMLGGRPLDGIDRMRAERSMPHLLADALASRLEFREALALVGGAAATEADKADGRNATVLRHLYGTRKGRLLSQLGEREAASQVFNGLADQLLTTGRDDYSLSQLLKAEVRAGRFDLACEHLGRSQVGADGDTGWQSGGRLDPFEAAFEADAEAARYWWRVLRADDRDAAPGRVMRRVRSMLAGDAGPKERDQALAAAGRDAPPPESPRGQARALALAAAYRAAGRPGDAVAALSEAADALAGQGDGDEADALLARRYGRGSRSWVFGTDERFRLWMELGDLLADAGRWREAAGRYEQGWRRFPDNPLLLYLSGRALLKAGDEAEGRKRVEQSRWVGLGNALVRGRFLDELIARGFAADVRRERDLIRDIGWLGESNIGNVWNQVARAAVYLKDYEAAGAANLRAMHYLLRTPGVSYVEGQAYLTIPQAVRLYEARAALAAGKSDAAVSIARECLRILPGNGDVPAGLAPGLDRAGRPADADKLFRAVWDAYAGLIAAHPGSAWAHYSAAWLAAGCRRELHAALAHAKKAVELDPDVRSYREGLAEVHFRRGERPKAVALMAKLSAADSRNHHYRRQLDRYRTAGFDSPLPESGDD